MARALRRSTEGASGRTGRLDAPLSNGWCAVGWVVATAVFVALVRVLKGPNPGDDLESAIFTWAFAHGHFSCAYPSGTAAGLPFMPPVYPLLSAGLAAVTRVGGGTSFPSQQALGPHCASTVSAVVHWSLRSDALPSTLRLGYVAWVVLAVGVVALLRACGRGRCLREPLVLLVLACTPPVFMCLERFFHPEDLVAMGCVTGALACARRARWVLAGVLIGLGMLSQQFVLLVAVPLLVVVPLRRIPRFVASAAVAGAVVGLPLIVVTSGRALKAMVGPGYQTVTQHTVAAIVIPHGAGLFIVSRLLPIALSGALALWARRRLGDGVMQPGPLLSLVATCLSLRLVFEVNLYGYYFMATALLLVLADVVRGRIRLSLVAWIAAVTLVFDPLPWGSDPFTSAPMWLCQVLLVPAAVALAAVPFLRSVLTADRGTALDHPRSEAVVA
jgi:hypothetical protein